MTTPVRPAEPAETEAQRRAHDDTVGHVTVAWCGFGRGGDVHSVWCVSRADAIRRAMSAARAEAGSLRERLSAVEGDRDALANEVHVQAARNQRLVEDLAAGTSNTTRMLLKQREAAEARVSELRGLLERKVGKRVAVKDGCTCWLCCARLWLAAHPLKTEGDV